MVVLLFISNPETIELVLFINLVGLDMFLLLLGAQLLGLVRMVPLPSWRLVRISWITQGKAVVRSMAGPVWLKSFPGHIRAPASLSVRGPASP